MENIKIDKESEHVSVPKAEVNNNIEKLDDYNIFSNPKPEVIKYDSKSVKESEGTVIKYDSNNLKEKEEQLNVNVDPDNIVIDSNTISDDAFFDDFFSEDE